MRNKESRLEAIKMIVSSQAVSSQDELLRELAHLGYDMTQATLSRDLKLLKVVKVCTSEGSYRYVLPASPLYRRVSDRHLTLSAMHGAGALSVKFSGNLAVIHTLPGHASHIAYDIDNRHFGEILGTLAGDDTIILVMAEGTERGRVLDCLAEVIPEIK